MPDFLGGYVIHPETVYPFAKAYGYDYWSAIDPEVAKRATRVAIMSPLNLINSTGGRRFPRPCLKAVPRKKHPSILFFPTYRDASMDENYMVPENEQDKKFLERWLEPFIEKCSLEDIQNFHEETKFGTVRLPIGMYDLSEPDDW